MKPSTRGSACINPDAGAVENVNRNERGLVTAPRLERDVELQRERWLMARQPRIHRMNASAVSRAFDGRVQVDAFSSNPCAT